MKPCTIIIFGATGDLSKKKLLPALYHLNIENRLTDDTKIICMGRRELAQDDWKSQVSDYVSIKARDGVNANALENFLAKVSYFKNIHNRLAYDFQMFLPIGLSRKIKNTIEDFDLVHMHGHRNFLNNIARRHAVRLARSWGSAGASRWASSITIDPP